MECRPRVSKIQGGLAYFENCSAIIGYQWEADVQGNIIVTGEVELVYLAKRNIVGQARVSVDFWPERVGSVYLLPQT